MSLQARLDEAKAAGGGTVNLSFGTFRPDEPLRVPTNVTVRGQGPATVIEPSHDGPAFTTVAPGSRQYNLGVENLSIVGSGGPAALDWDSVSQGWVSRVSVRGFAVGLRLHSSVAGGTVYNEFYGLSLFDCDVGVDLDGPAANENRWFGGRINGRTGGARVRSGNHNTFFGVSMEGDGTGVAVLCDGSAARVDSNVWVTPRIEGWQTALKVVGPSARANAVQYPHLSGLSALVDDGGERTAFVQA